MSDLTLNDLVKISAVRRAVEAHELRQRLNTLRLSGSDVAKAIGVTTPAVTRWVKGERTPRTNEALLLAEILFRDHDQPEDAHPRPEISESDYRLLESEYRILKQEHSKGIEEAVRLHRQLDLCKDRLMRMEDYARATSRGKTVDV